jgi:hypothetical protein
MPTRAEDNPFPSILMVEQDKDALTEDSPAVGSQRLVVDSTDHGLYLVDDTDTATAVGGGGFSDPMTSRGDIIIRNASNVTARLAKGSANTYLGSDGTDVSYSAVTDAKLSTSDITTNDASTSKHGFLKKLDNNAAHYMDGTGAWSTPSGSGATDPITAVFGAADTAFEFASSSLSGLTALGTPDAEAAHTTIPDHYYLADNASSTAWCGRYMTIPSYPFTAMTKVSDSNSRLNYNATALFLSQSTPGKMIVTSHGKAARCFGTEIFTNPTTFGSTVTADSFTDIEAPVYIAVVATSTSSTTWYVSFNGYVWIRLTNAADPSMTIGSVGIAAKSENSAGLAAAFDWFRVWNSSKTFLTGV